MRTLDQRTIDSTGSFLIGQLEQLDRTIHEPLQSFKWSRDINVRTDATIGHDFTSFTNSAMASVGGIDPTKKAFISKDSTTLPNVALDIGKTVSPLIPWGLECNFSIFELESAMMTTGGSIDEQKFNALKKKHQQDIDIQVYLGDTNIPNAYGLLNSPQVTTGAVAANGTGSSTLWINKTPQQILADVNAILTAAWTASAFEYVPSKLLVSPVVLGYLSQTIISIGGVGGGMSILTFLEQNSICLRENGRPLQVLSSKWCTGTNNGNALGVNATDMIFAYTQQYDLVRFPMVPMMGLPVQFKGIHQVRPYVCKLGLVEFVYPETLISAYGVN